jgi:hypothetical protein
MSHQIPQVSAVPTNQLKDKSDLAELTEARACNECIDSYGKDSFMNWLRTIAERGSGANVEKVTSLEKKFLAS